MSRLLALACLLAFLAYLMHRPTRAPRQVNRREAETSYDEWLALWERTAA